ncbi:MAG: putative sulfate exporter family transporter [Thioclava marina]|uniref:YeiH family protein n=1 Tax=Thioclava marina TaxID=1915077 RepID=UPI0019BBBE6E|nr:putative sulfate exporter family transporter [Thioclava marina]MBC7147066.1 putative sulfate exporter family transporter [Thioclava marina]
MALQISVPQALRRPHQRLREIAPGLVLSIGVAAIAEVAARAEQVAFGAQWLEPLVLAILIGAMVRTFWKPQWFFLSGISFSAKTVLEIAIVLLGASVSAQTLLSVGPGLLTGIVAVVALVVPGAYLLGRALGLPARMALLIACGNGICGNSAIAAVAPVIEADSDDVSASIAFTAVLGVAVVLLLPLLGHALTMGSVHYGILSGLTVYAVPQVLAAAAPMGHGAIQIGTLVKLVRVLMLGPITVVLSLLASRLPEEGRNPNASGKVRKGLMPPLFILGFLAMIAARSAGVIPHLALAPMGQGASILTVIAMAALGLGVDARAVAAAGPRVIATVTLSLVLLVGLGLGLVALLAG